MGQYRLNVPIAAILFLLPTATFAEEPKGKELAASHLWSLPVGAPTAYSDHDRWRIVVAETRGQTATEVAGMTSVKYIKDVPRPLWEERWQKAIDIGVLVGLDHAVLVGKPAEEADLSKASQDALKSFKKQVEASEGAPATPLLPTK